MGVGMAVARRAPGRRTDYQWNGVSGLRTIALGETQVLLGTVCVFSSSQTLMRVRGRVAVGLDVPSADAAMVVGVGMIIGDANQVTAGSTAFPSPIEDLAADWLWHGLYPLQSITGTQVDILGGQWWQETIDSKAMRKVKATEVIAVMVDGNILQGAPTADVILAARCLTGR